jgi:hypothetical protein
MSFGELNDGDNLQFRQTQSEREIIEKEKAPRKSSACEKSHFLSLVLCHNFKLTEARRE